MFACWIRKSLASAWKRKRQNISLFNLYETAEICISLTWSLQFWTLSKGVITWRTSVRAEMLLQLHNKFQLGIKYKPFCFLENNLTAQALFVLSARAEITWTVCRFFSPFRVRKAVRKTTTYLFCKAGLLICCKGNKNKNNCKVSCLETPSFWRYKENYVTRNTPEKFRDFRETGPWTPYGLNE